MNSKKASKIFRLAPVAAALLAVFGSAYAEDSSDEVKQMINPDSFVNVGLGNVNNTNDAKRFGQYTGMNQGNVYGLVDFEWNKRDNDTGTWTVAKGRNLGLDTRELGFTHNKQGDWKYALDYNEIVRNDPYIIHTGMTGVGTATPTINLIATPSMPAAWATDNGLTASNGVAGSDIDLKVKRTAIGISGEKRISQALSIEASFRNEDKKGERMFGRVGYTSSDMGLSPVRGTGSANGAWAVLLTPEPIKSSIKQFDLKANYVQEKFALTGGYYASFYVNDFGNLAPNVPAALNRGALWNNASGGVGTPVAGANTVQQIASSPIALPPDNQSHQLYLTGNYSFTQDTRGNFKLAYTHATQNESFAGMGLTAATGAPASLSGVVDTTLAQLGVTSRATDKLSLNGSLRYEDRSDKTPVYVYNTDGKVGNALNGTTNWPSGSQKRTTLKLDGIYRMADGYSTMVGVDWERKTTPLPPSNTALFAGQVLFRSTLTETGVHGELRKSLSETLNGAVGVEYKQRRGDSGGWVTTSGTSNLADPATSNALVAFDPAGASGNRVLPAMYMDKNRTKVRGSLDWDASNRLSVQTVVEHAKDDFLRDFNQSLAAPTLVLVNVPGARTVISDSFSLDTSYVPTDEIRFNAYWTYSYNRWNVNKASLGDDTRNVTNTVGLGFSDKLKSYLTVGLDILATHDTTTFNNLVATAAAGQAPGNTAGWTGQTLPGNYLPKIHYQTEKLNLYAKYAVQKNADALVNLTYMHFKTDDWQWGYNGVPFLYSDNTTVSQPSSQKLFFIAARYVYRY